ncbi:MAG: fumarylacetoacetate hydrolase family protein [Bacteroidales bacterium]|nr:fumarylacetoacetate hydrolase family protein [Candidatus Physcousia equi]
MKIFGIGMNYSRHTTELEDVLKDNTARLAANEPVIFTKCDSALLRPGNPFFLPDYTKQCEHEAELVVRIGHMGRSIPERWVMRYIDAMTVGIDFTARDLQQQLSAKGLPWDLAKGFDGSAAIGEWVHVDEHTNLQDVSFRLEKNGVCVQEANSRDMIHSVTYIVSYISQFFTLKTGDLIYTGTPAGVGTVQMDDHLVGYLQGEKRMDFFVK